MNTTEITTASLMAAGHDAKSIARQLDDRREAVCRYLWPNGRKQGQEWVVGDVAGTKGSSFKVHLNGKGSVWCDFATGQSGADVLDAWAAKIGGDRGRAMCAAATWLGLDVDQRNGNGGKARTRKATPAKAPSTTTEPPTEHPKLGKPDHVYFYTDAAGAEVMQVWRWNATTDRAKEIRPLHFDGKKWTWKDPPGLLPLYRLADIIARPVDQVVFLEGEKAVDHACDLIEGMVFTTWPHGSNAIDKADWSPVALSSIVLMADADEPGEKAMQAIADKLIDLGFLGCNIRIAEPLHELGEGADLADCTTPEHVDLALRKIAEAKDVRIERLADLGTLTADGLMTMELPEPRWIIEPYLTEGLGLLCGRPKIGKSWMALGLAAAVAGGTNALGKYRTAVGDALYLALEDNLRRLQKRMKTILQGAPAPAKLDLATEWRKLEDGGLDDLGLWLDMHPDARMVIVDTLAKVRTARKANADIYEHDYAIAKGLKDLADQHQVAIVLVHHLRKATDDDVLNEVSGSTGLTGSVDAILVIKRERGEADASLFATGRDISEADHALQFDAATCRWTVIGEADAYRITKERRAVIRAITEAGEPMTASEIAAAIDKRRDAIRQLLRRMVKAGEILQREDQRYDLLPL